MKVTTLKKYVTVINRIECHFCGTKEEFENDYDWGHSLFGNCAKLVEKGWREVSSTEYQVVAAACPTCAKKKSVNS